MKEIVINEIRTFFSLKPNSRSWHIPVMAAICAGVPAFLGWYFDQLQLGLVGSLGGLVILYFNPKQSIALRMLTLLLAAMGFILSFAIGSICGFNPYVGAVTIGLFSLGIHWVAGYFQLKPPGSFFFIMLAATSATQFTGWELIPTRIGIIALSTSFACLLGLLYSILVWNNDLDSHKVKVRWQPQFTSLVESIILGTTISIAMLIGTWLKLPNAYWIPISALAVMQGVSRYHIWQRSAQRIFGTMTGLLLAFGLLELTKVNPLYAVISIVILQLIIEFLIVRNYAIAVIFITPMTILLADASGTNLINSSDLIFARVIDIVLGSTVGAIGGYFLYHEKIKHKAVRSLRVIRISLKR